MEARKLWALGFGSFQKFAWFESLLYKRTFQKNISATRKPSNLSLNLAKTPTAPKSKKLRATYLELFTLRNNEWNKLTNSKNI